MCICFKCLESKRGRKFCVTIMNKRRLSLQEQSSKCIWENTYKSDIFRINYIFKNISFKKFAYTFSVLRYQLELINYHVHFQKFRFFSFSSRADNSSVKLWYKKTITLLYTLYHSCEFGFLYFCRYRSTVNHDHFIH
jgi:hypothetical protein